MVWIKINVNHERTFLGEDDLQLPQYGMNNVDDTEIDFVLSVTPDYQKSQVHQPLDQKLQIRASNDVSIFPNINTTAFRMSACGTTHSWVS